MSLKLGAAYGRLTIAGPDAALANRLPGAFYNLKRGWYEASLTLPTLRLLRQQMGLDRPSFARLCTPVVLDWARAAAAEEMAIVRLHEQLESGWRLDLPWADTPGHPVTHHYRPPFEHQRIMASASCSLAGTPLLCGMGTGKTRVAIETIAYRRVRFRSHWTLIVCPKGVRGTWMREARMWQADGWTVESLMEMPVPDRIQRIEAGEPGVYVVNYEVLGKMERAIVRRAKESPLDLVLDEAHLVRNPSAKMSKAARAIAEAAASRLLLTGTPILNGAENIWNQMYCTDLGVALGANYVQFERQYFRVGYNDFGLVPLPGTLDTIAQVLNRRAIRYRKEDCLDLPPKLYETITVILSPDQRRAYTEMKEELVTQLDAMGERATASTQLVAMQRLAQITSGFVKTTEGTIHRFDPNPKLDTLVRLVEEQIEQQQILVWAWYKEDVSAIRGALARFQPLVISGKETPKERDHAETEFQAGRCRVLILNPAVGRLGLNLFAASLAIYYSQTFDLDHRAQSEDRCHRAGSERHHAVTYIDLTAEHSIDEIIARNLDRKQDVATTVLDLRRHLAEPDPMA